MQRNKIVLVTLGCSKNVVDSELLLRQIQANDWEVIDDPAHATTVVINTCGFIEAAKRESIDAIIQAVGLKREGKLSKIVVVGCLSERYMEELKKEIPEVDLFVGANKIEQVVVELGGALRHELLGERVLSTPRHFAYVKISEGCDRPCSFCSIPLIRGKHVSKPMDRIVTEVRRLAALGVREIILIAQDSTYYGLDLYGKRMLASLLEQLSRVDGIAWIRLMYAFPSSFPMDVLDQFTSNPKLCGYLDLPVQHISDPILGSMQRGITSKKLRNLIEAIRVRIPDIALRTTLIVGYPNEGEREFQELVEFVKEAQFDRLGVFTYSQEDGTAAYRLGDPIPSEEKEERQNFIMKIQQEISLRKNRALVGSTRTVLIDEKEGDTAIGRTEHDAPDVDNEVTVHGARSLSVGEFHTIAVVDAEAYDLFAIPVEYGRKRDATSAFG